ncbi:ATP-binding cassette domain-containing protein, partial [Xanthomonas citri pv. citri]|nr:ATP-binding cassette domain-containing protein [Xanthomonas citri pv. citri]
MNTHTALTLPSPGRTEAPAIPAAPASDAPPAPPMLSIRHVSKHYGGVPAVQDVSFDVPAGRITGFVGPNGAGKSTVLRMALGL